MAKDNNTKKRTKKTTSAKQNESKGITETLMSNLIQAHENQIKSLHEGYKAQLDLFMKTIREKDKRIERLETELKTKK